MSKILKGEPVADFPQPVFGGQRRATPLPPPSATPSTDPVGVALQQRPAAAQADADADAEPAAAVTYPDPHPDAVGVRHDTLPPQPGFPRPKLETEARSRNPRPGPDAGRSEVWARMRR